MSKKKLKPKTIVIFALAILLLVISLFPYYYMLVQSFADWKLVDKTILPKSFTIRSFEYLLNNGGTSNPYLWMRALLNSFVISIITAIISVVVGLLTGYSVTKLKFHGGKVINNLLIFQMFFPVIILLVPRYIIAKPFVNTYVGMILPMAISTWAIYMYINYIVTLPNEIFEAVKIDGANDWQAIFYIAIPVTKSITTIVFLSTFMMRWSELMWDMIISPRIDMQTLNVLISTQFKPMGNMPGPMYASSVLLTAPIIILFLCFSKYFKEGISFMLK